MNKENLLLKAKEARKLSYSPYSNFAVGAAVETKDGQVFLGANVENSAYPLCMCAERNALYNAMMHGYKKDDIVALALCADTDNPCSPCGACRQVMVELLNPETVVVLTDEKLNTKEMLVKDLLPNEFKLEG